MLASIIMTISYALLVIETLAGVVANGFIVLLNSIDWFRSRNLAPVDLILTCLSVSRIMWQAIVFLDDTIHFFSLDIRYQSCMRLIGATVWKFSNTASVWFATWLSVFYFTKIAIFSHPVFLQVKRRISGLMPWLLLGSVVLSAIMTFTEVIHLNNDLSMGHFCRSALTINGSENKTSSSIRYLDSLMSTPNVIAFLIFLSSSVLLMTSLWKHTRHLQHNGIGTKDLNTRAHWTAITSLISFAVLYLASFLAISSLDIVIWNNMDHTWLSMLLNNIIVAHPSGHAMILILLHPKLKQTWVRMLHRSQCCLSEKDRKTLWREHPLPQGGP